MTASAVAVFLGLLPFALIYALVIAVPRWWHALLIVIGFAALTYAAHFDWYAWEQANPNHGGKFAGFEVVILAILTVYSAYAALAGRLMSFVLHHKKARRVVRIGEHALALAALPLLVYAARFLNDAIQYGI